MLTVYRLIETFENNEFLRESKHHANKRLTISQESVIVNHRIKSSNADQLSNSYNNNYFGAVIM